MINRVSATGVLRRIAKGDSGHEEITVLVKRPMIGDTSIQFVLETTLSSEIKFGTPIHIEGQVRGFYLRDSSGKAKVTQYLVANKVSEAKGELETVFGVKGHFNPRHDIKMYVEGTITSVLDSSKGWKSLLVVLDGTREVPDIITVGFRGNDRIPEFNDIRKDDRIMAVLNIRSNQKKINGETRRFQNIVVEDIVITNREITQQQNNEIYDYLEEEE